MVTQPYVNKRSIVIHIGSYSKMLIFKPYNKFKRAFIKKAPMRVLF
ncbi:hypothetical protein JOC75_003814 [Metabacillus crassostreae]|nr:hypothetical protein [Metabacillus crassostreae]